MKTAGSYTSFTPVDDRFEYKKKGIFRCRFKKESVYILAFVAGIILVNLFVITMAIISKPPSLAYLVFGISKWIVPLLSPFILIGGIRVFLSGAFYNYTVDDEKMLIVCPRENYRADIFFNTVLGVEYTDLLRLTRKYGFRVTVTCTDNTYTYDFIFPHGVHNMREDLTPFRIIEERCGFVAPPEYYAGQRIDNI